MRRRVFQNQSRGRFTAAICARLHLSLLPQGGSRDERRQLCERLWVVWLEVQRPTQICGSQGRPRAVVSTKLRGS